MTLFTKVDKDTCIACSSCIDCAPDVYEYDSEGLSSSILDDNKGVKEVPEDMVEDVLDAYDSCPSDSIKISSEKFK